MFPCILLTKKSTSLYILASVLANSPIKFDKWVDPFWFTHYNKKLYTLMSYKTLTKLLLLSSKIRVSELPIKSLKKIVESTGSIKTML